MPLEVSLWILQRGLITHGSPQSQLPRGVGTYVCQSSIQKREATLDIWSRKGFSNSRYGLTQLWERLEGQALG